MLVDRFHGAMRQARIHRPGPVGRAVHLANRQADRHGQALAAVAGGLVERRPSGVNVLRVGLPEPGWRLHFAAVKHAAAFPVAHGIEGRHDFLGKLAGLFEDGVDELLVDFLAAGQRLVVLFQVQQVLHHETHVAQGGFVGRHRSRPGGRAIGPQFQRTLVRTTVPFVC